MPKPNRAPGGNCVYNYAQKQPSQATALQAGTSKRTPGDLHESNAHHAFTTTTRAPGVSQGNHTQQCTVKGGSGKYDLAVRDKSSSKPAAEFENNSTFQVEMWVVVGKSRSRYKYL